MNEMTIQDVYQYTHKLIKENPNLVSKIRELVVLSLNRRENTYLSTGLSVDGIFLGLDFKINHIARFEKIAINNIAIDRVSFYQADLSRVLMRVVVDGKHVANLTEDVSENGKFEINDQGCLLGHNEDYLTSAFGKSTEDLRRTVFIVYNKFSFLKRRKDMEKPELITVRMPIIDLDHVDPDKLLVPFFQLIEKDVENELDFYTLNI